MTENKKQRVMVTLSVWIVVSLTDLTCLIKFNFLDLTNVLHFKYIILEGIAIGAAFGGIGDSTSATFASARYSTIHSLPCVYLQYWVTYFERNYSLAEIVSL